MLSQRFYTIFVSPIQPYRCASTLLRKNRKFCEALAEAENIIGQPRSLVNLRCALTEVTEKGFDLADSTSKIDPSFDSTRNLLLDTKTSPWGLTLLLITKAFGLNSNFHTNECDASTGILHSQLNLASTAEILRGLALMHDKILNLNHKKKLSLRLNWSNKLFILSGDQLIAKYVHQLACLRMSRLNEIMISILRDLSEVPFWGLHDENGIPLPTKPSSLRIKEFFTNFEMDPNQPSDVLGNPEAEWIVRTILNGGSILGKSCKCSLMLAKHSEEVQNHAYTLGRCIALGWQARIDQEAFYPESYGSFSLVNAPVMLFLKHNPSLYDKIEENKHNALGIDYDSIRNCIQNSDALQKTQLLQKRFLTKALDILSTLPESDSRAILENIIENIDS